MNKAEEARYAAMIAQDKATLAGILIVAVTVYLSYRFASRLIARLGETGTNVFLRLSAFILFCLGIQILWTGMNDLIIPLLSPRAGGSS